MEGEERKNVVNLLDGLQASAFTSSSFLNNQSTAYHSRMVKINGEFSRSCWYANVQAPHQWIQVDFGVAKMFTEILVTSSVLGEYIKYSTIYCGLDYFSVRAIGRFRLHSAKGTYIKVGLRYCRTVRLIVHDWKTKIALRWRIIQAPGVYS